MNNLTPKQLRGLYVVIEINFFLWSAIFGAVLLSLLWPNKYGYEITLHLLNQSIELNLIVLLAIGGNILAILLQHWAYYNLYKRTKQTNSKVSPK